MGKKFNTEGLLYEGNEPYIFISYAHKDEEVVLPMIEALLWRGFRVWYDLGIPHGSNWDDVVADHLNQSSVMIACLSSGFVDSLYCCNEIRTAIQKQIPILMLFVEDENSFKLPPGIAMNTVSNNRMYRDQYLTQERFMEALYKEPLLQSCQQEIPPDLISENSQAQFDLKKIVGRNFGKSAIRFLYKSIIFCVFGLASATILIEKRTGISFMDLRPTETDAVFMSFKNFLVSLFAGSNDGVLSEDAMLGLLGALTAGSIVAGLLVLMKYSCMSFYSKTNKWYLRYEYAWYCYLIVAVSGAFGLLFYPEVLLASMIFSPLLILMLLGPFEYRDMLLDIRKFRLKRR